MFCPKCGKETIENAAFCDVCGASLAGRRPAKKRTRLSGLAGAVDIVDGGLKSLFAFLGAFGIINQVSEHDYEYLPGAVFVTIVLAVLAVLALVGGICALRRRGWGWALAGAIAAILPFFPLGITSAILTVMARDEFERQTTPQ